MLKYSQPSKQYFFTHISTLVFMLFCAFGFTSCGDGEQTPNVSGIKVTLDARRFDKDLAAIDTANIAAGLQQLKTKYPYFLDFYLDTLMGLKIHGNYTDTADAIHTGLRTYLTYKDYRGLLDTVAVHFPDISSINEQLTKGFQYMLNYYPKYQVPKVIYSVFWLNKLPVFMEANGNIGIDLDMFLGPQYPYYKSVGVPDYTANHLVPGYIPVAVFTLICDDMYPFQSAGRNLLDMMIQRGKQQYFLSKILPFMNDAERMAYSKADLEGCEKNKVQIYNFFVKNDLLYNKDLQTVYRFVNDGPNTEQIAKECPGNIGTWLGYQIVKSYMKEHPETTLQQLFQDSDPQKFLEDSKYNPR
ncbi:MAG: hypothetical protein BGO69_19940 [Bacteroidetes bacterium 46-16]|nr:MAG: hypothetical protein BGO69_19940 [Bacteroidetes bacterium 46-16]